MQNRDKILENVERMFMKHGVRSVTMDDIARDLGMSKKTLYLHFENKADLLKQILDAHLSNEHEQLEAIRNRAQNAIDEMLLINEHVMRMLSEINTQVIFDLQRYYPDTWMEFNERNEQEIFHTVFNNLKRGMREEVYRFDLNPEIIARLYVYRSGFMLDQKMHWCNGSHNLDFIRQVLVYHMHGVMNDTGRKVFDECLKMKA